MPIGLINGSTHREGLRPPFRPHAVLVGLPWFPVGCLVTGDADALAEGRRTDLRLHARVSIDDDQHRVVIENIPPNITTEEVAHIVAERASPRPWAAGHPGLHRLTGLPLADLRDETTERYSPSGRIICTPRGDTTPEQLRDMLVHVPGVTTTMPVQLPRPLATIIRSWVRASAREDLAISLARLERALASQP